MNKTGIRWTDYSSNPIRVIRIDNGKKGWMCSRVGEECRHCYAATINRRLGTGLDYTEENLEKVEFLLDEREFDEWHKLKAPSKIFVVDMSDLFHPTVSDEFKDRIFSEMADLPRHTFQVLTKRPGIMQRYFDLHGRPPDNIWLGTSVGTARLKPFIKVLQAIEAKTRFLSIEPLLENLGELDLTGISWVIVGGESGPGYRTMQLEWARNIRDQCIAQKIPLFYKQSSGIHPEMGDTDADNIPDLDGVRWEQYPDANNSAAFVHNYTQQTSMSQFIKNAPLKVV